MRILLLELSLLLAGCGGPPVLQADDAGNADKHGFTLTWTEGNEGALSGDLLATNGGSTTWYLVGSSSCVRHLNWGIEDRDGNSLDISPERYHVCTADMATMAFAPGETRQAQVSWDGKAWDAGMTERSPVPAGDYTLVAYISGDDEPPKEYRVDEVIVVTLRVPVRIE